MDIITSILTLLALGAMALKFFWAPIFGALVQCWWILYIMHIKEYGLFVSTIPLLMIYLSSIPKWWRER